MAASFNKDLLFNVFDAVGDEAELNIVSLVHPASTEGIKG